MSEVTKMLVEMSESGIDIMSEEFDDGFAFGMAKVGS